MGVGYKYGCKGTFPSLCISLKEVFAVLVAQEGADYSFNKIQETQFTEEWQVFDQWFTRNSQVELCPCEAQAPKKPLQKTQDLYILLERTGLVLGLKFSPLQHRFLNLNLCLRLNWHLNDLFPLRLLHSQCARCGLHMVIQNNPYFWCMVLDFLKFNLTFKIKENQSRVKMKFQSRMEVFCIA